VLPCPPGRPLRLTRTQPKLPNLPAPHRLTSLEEVRCELRRLAAA
jgi:hypothetical protein